ncbi:hypothetical protein O181_010659 [Austropuccinia psidii MF-1]|uniref:SUN domain-containing protein n=1 Tax=Austropuccinia psidii MF-1 TaxID=1389203 RepID=A0A9Q3BT28_9BASI|nr:hypothetical protein [Austropuccinia psidii MF-1]
MFSFDTPPQSKRQSFKNFTNQLIHNNNKTASGHPLMTASSTQSQQNQPIPSSSTIATAATIKNQKEALIPSASLILGKTSKIQPKLPINHQSSNSSLNQLFNLHHRQPNSNHHPQLNSSNQNFKSNLNSKLPSSSSHSSSTNLLPTSTNNQPQSAMVSKPSNSNDTSVNIASAFERAKWAARAKQVLNNHNDSDTNRDLDPDHQNQHDPSNSNPIDLTDLNENNQLSNSKKRKKARRSLDPTYKYRPGDSASSDSAAGEGIADKRDRREKKARLLEKDSNNPSADIKKRKFRRSSLRQTTGSDELTDSQEETSPGSTTRSKKTSKDTQPDTQKSINSNVRTRKRNGSIHKSIQDDQNQDHMVSTRSRRQSIQTSQLKPTATFFLAHPDSIQQSTSITNLNNHQNQDQDHDHTLGTTDSSRLTLRLSGDSYDFAEEERIVKALESKSLQQQSLATETSNTHNSRLENFNFDNPPHSHNLSPLDNQSIPPGDPGLREIEQVVTSHQRVHKSRILPLPIPSQPAIISPTCQDDQRFDHDSQLDPQEELVANSIPQSFGTKWGSRCNKILITVFRTGFWSQFAWVTMLITLALALLINSYRIGDLAFPFLSWSSSTTYQRPVYHAPTSQVDSVEELVNRLKKLENALSTVSIDQLQDFQKLEKMLKNDKIEFGFKLSRLELKLEDEEKVREKLESKVTKEVEDKVKKLKNEIEGLGKGRKHDHSELESLKRSLNDLDQRQLSANHGLTIDQVQKMILQSTKQASTLDIPQIKQSILDSVMSKVIENGYLTKSEIGETFGDELRLVGLGFERQLDQKVEKVRQELLQASSSRSTMSRKIDSGGQEELKDTVEEMIEEALERYSNDGIGKRDFALFTGGARIIPQYTSNTYEIRPKNWSDRVIAFVTGTDSVIRGRGPATVLSPESEVGMCWPINGSTGQIGIYLSRKVKVTEISIEHASRQLALDLDSAPREIEVWGIEDDKKLVEMTYDPYKGPRVQTFKVFSPPKADLSVGESEDDHQQTAMEEPTLNEDLRQGILVKIKSNHGNPFYTCLYRIRVHGLMESEI